MTTLSDRVRGPVYQPGDDGFAAAAAGFNLSFAPRPDLVVTATSVDDVVEAVRFARSAGMRVSVQGTGHGAEAPIESGLLIITSRLDHLTVDPAACVATIGAGVRWKAVVDAAAEHGLAPVTGSSPAVGAVGYLLGGGVGPLARSHGFSSDYATGFTVVTGEGDVVEADADTNPDLFWALRGGKFGLGVVTEMRVRLVELTSVYGGSFFVDTSDIERMLRAWIDWTDGADDRVTTSVQLVGFPPLPEVPEPMRGKLLLSVRFAFPGDPAEGQRLVAPLRAAAPVYLDMLGELPATELGRIHNDPADPIPAYVHGNMLDRIDQGLGTAFLDVIGPGAPDSPFFAGELRHLGAATSRDVPGGSAVGGRGAGFACAFVAGQPELFATAAPAAAAHWDSTAAPWISDVNNANVVSQPITAERVAACWPDDIRERLGQVRRRYDPDQLTAGWWQR
ncbi:FAD/FMN-containing dehydrogenase [Asanoa ferruginea]|uniref:FAD/FMN-containing dehydrogenase n=1 Tax=Asanoa ferruginea TaxID=53367 RepID=A0A3D9ZQF0_9ACTN|nr:FAD-binding oxidoreductase [Asanoa ferruginea]REF98864.1 FAD/FMN-containing dehydrogenase [Asanoa ferruginea]GIF46455.1 FAD-linked oxidase [Asanoa ferruginea]